MIKKQIKLKQNIKTAYRFVKNYRYEFYICYFSIAKHFVFYIVNMVQQVTRGIKISVVTTYERSFYNNHKIQYAFVYTITIENQSKDSVQLNARHWQIFDALNTIETVSGEGVVGKKPVIKPGESHTYISGCTLVSPFGAMLGYYSMVNLSTTKKFKVSIPVFKLSAPFAMN